MHVFDRLVSVMRSPYMFQGFVPAVRDCKLFQFTRINPVQDDMTTMDDTILATDAAFRINLPFPATAVTFKNIAIVFDQKNCQGATGFVFMYRCEDTPHAGGMVAVGYIKPTIVSNDEVDPVLTVDQWLSEKNCLLTPHGTLPADHEIQATLKALIVAAYTAIIELNTIDRFVLEIKPKKPSKKSLKPGAIPKLADRPEYCLLTPKEIRKYLGTHAEDTGRVQSVHERRGHIRTYPDDKERFPNAHGKSIWIDAVWIGESEAIVGNKKYKVILDNPNKNNGETS